VDLSIGSSRLSLDRRRYEVIPDHFLEIVIEHSGLKAENSPQSTTGKRSRKVVSVNLAGFGLRDQPEQRVFGN
jgi:hypothetical protein